MMALKIEGATHRMKAPEGQPDVRDLFAKVIDGSFVSRWEPTPDELATLNSGGSVELWVRGCQPPVYVGVAEKA